MLCRLCTADCGDCTIKLFDTDGQRTAVYNVVVKYFEDQLKKMDVLKEEFFDLQQSYSERVICGSCWQRINDFHQWQTEVLAAQEQLEKFSKQSNHEFFDGVKLESEVEMENMDVFMDPFPVLSADDSSTTHSNAEEDPVGISERKLEVTLENIAALHKTVCDNIDNACSDDDEDDDKPLILRIGKFKKETLTSTKDRRKSPKVRKKKPEAAIISNHDSVAKDAKQDNESEEKKHNKRISKNQEYDLFIANHFKAKLPCELCGAALDNFTDLHAHFRSTHNTDCGYVVCCQHKYSRRFHLVEHLRLHLNPQLYQCSECGKCSANRRSLATHIKSQHGAPLERQFECEVCHKRFAKKAILKTHMELHADKSKDYICKECGKGFAFESRLNIHVRNVHSNEFRSVCEQCGKSFRGRYALKYHLLEHSGAGKRKWPCNECNAKLYSKSSLKRHIRLAHIERTTAYICSECGKVSPNEDALRSHKRYVHEQERKYKCNICEKAFKTAIILREHMTTHTGEHLYQCPHCPRTFKVSANMHHHRKRKHPKEWAENRKHRPAQQGRLDLSTISNEVVL